VVIISEDGLRPDALMNVLPPVHADLMKRAAYSLTARTIRRASTLPSHAAMLSGFDVKQHGLYWNSWHPDRGWIQVPTIFDEAEQHGGTTAAFVGKKKLEHIAHPGSVDYFSRPGYFCKKVVAEAADYLVKNRPQIEFIHFSDPDDLGHSDGWMSNSQFEAVRHTDKCLRTLLDATAASGLDRDTLFILSADHGGHGRNHDGHIPEDRLIPWIAWGPGVRPGHKIESPIITTDTAATALWALGLPAPPDMKGKPVLEAFDAPPTASNP
jgi:predicted AlkP superfamily pyrophosphatase or phosphodiesterase